MKWNLQALNIKNTFLHRYVDDELYMLPPPGYFKALPGQVRKLKRSPGLMVLSLWPMWMT